MLRKIGLLTDVVRSTDTVTKVWMTMLSSTKTETAAAMTRISTSMRSNGRWLLGGLFTKHGSPSHWAFYAFRMRAGLSYVDTCEES